MARLGRRQARTLGDPLVLGALLSLAGAGLALLLVREGEIEREEVRALPGGQGCFLTAPRPSADIC
jgi:hypothetical protein